MTRQGASALDGCQQANLKLEYTALQVSQRAARLLYRFKGCCSRVTYHASATVRISVMLTSGLAVTRTVCVLAELLVAVSVSCPAHCAGFCCRFP